MEQVFELLAPAGSLEILKADITAGADAVYLGGERFSARAYAGNFTDVELLDAIDYAHLYGRKVYLAVNTLFKNPEIGRQLYRYLLPLYERGLDAVLVQDIGVFSFIRQAFPDLPVHASTQMTVTDAGGVSFLAGLGARRIVLSRELSLEEIERIYEKTGAELEVFVHGALCYCYSGQCLFSSLLGGRSGNRGRCAQPCRLPYAVRDGEREIPDSHVLSLKDLCGIRDLDRLHRAGVYSLKIEGRMKQLSYAAGVVSVYRKYIDRYGEWLVAGEHTDDWADSVEAEDIERLLALGNRCGFTDGYFDRPNGADMVTFTKPSYERQETAGCEEDLQAPKIKAMGSLTLNIGERARYLVSSGEAFASVTGMEVQPADTQPLDGRAVIERMNKTGDTPFIMEYLVTHTDTGAFLPNGELNRMRREALEALADAFRGKDKRDCEGCFCPAPDQVPFSWRKCGGRAAAPKPRLICLTENRGLLPLFLEREFVTTVYLDAGAYLKKEWMRDLREDVERCRAAGKEVYLALPRVFRQRTMERYQEYSGELSDLLDGVLVRNYEEFDYARRKLDGLFLVLDHNLYTYNDYAICAFAALGAARDTVPLELNKKELAHRDNSRSEMVVYGRYPLMTSAQCVRANTGSCEEKQGLVWLTDRYGKKFPVKNFCADCCNVIYNSLPTVLFLNIAELADMGVKSFRLDFTVETWEETERVLDLYRAFSEGSIDKYPEEWHNRYTGGHYRRGVE